MRQKEEPGDAMAHKGEDESKSEGDEEAEIGGRRKKTRLMFERGLKEIFREGKGKMKEVGWGIMDNLRLLGTKFGVFAKILKDYQTKAPGTASPDLLPISIAGVEGFRGFTDRWEQGWAMLVCQSLNYWYCTGWDKPSNLEHSYELTKSQEKMLVDQIIPAVQRLLEEEYTIPPMKGLASMLEKKGQDYEGNSWVVMETLEADKVAACWPEPGKAAVQPLTKFLKGTTKEAVEAPMSTILDFDEWPEDVPKSYVRADQAEWEKLVAIGYERGLFHACPEEEVLKGPHGEKILNGAGAVPKEKDGKQLQRFISIFCPLNAVSKKIEGEEGTLPYVGQMCLLNIPNEASILVDSEDLQSAFNLFEMPIGWRGLFCYEKQVDGKVLGQEEGVMTYVALRTVPMGWLSAVGVVQAAIRSLAFDFAELPQEKEVQKWKTIPEGDKFLLYLDSCDQLRVVSQTLKKIVEGEASVEHQKFEESCRRLGLPRNEGKSLAGAVHGSIQGGELLGEKGIFTLNRSKMRLNVAMCLCLVMTPAWEQSKVSGIVGRLIFAGAFRRPLLAGLAEVFKHFERPGSRVPKEAAYDEMLAMIGLLPMAFTNIKAAVSPVLHATDASPTGAGSCVASCIKRDRGDCNPADLLCAECRREIGELIATGAEVECPKRCGKHFCSMDCYTYHREGCPMKVLGVPLFSERWSGPRAPLTLAMVNEGFDVTEPYDVQRGGHMDYFTERGKEQWKWLDEQGAHFEHHAPDCKTMSRARGRPFWIGNQRYDGPPALRDEYHVMGFPHLRGNIAVKVRQANKMAMASVQRCVKLDEEGKFFGLEHPYRSFLWYMKATIALAKRPGVEMAVFSNCCFGGRRRKWTAYLTNNSRVYEELHQPNCPHSAEDWAEYQPYFEEGQIVYPTEQEAEYPEGLCKAIARGFSRSMDLPGHLRAVLQEYRELEIEDELKKYHRCEDPELRAKMVKEIMALEARCTQGQEQAHVDWLLSQGHYRGADIRLATEYYGAKQLIPYPAGRWVWREVLSFKWRVEAHINELEAQALFAHVRRVLRDPQSRGVRLLIVIDSQVLFYALGKGRSPSTRLNRILRRLMALCVAADIAIFPIWTISSWNWADRPSRR